MLEDGSAVLRGAVAFVAGEAVLRELGVELAHEAVAIDLGDDGGGGDGDGKRVAVDDTGLRAGVVNAHGVDEEMVGRGREARDGGGHGEACGLVDVDAINGCGVDFCDGDGEGEGLDVGGEVFAGRGFEQLGVAKAGQTGFWRQNDRGGDNGTEEGAAAYFVDAGDEGGSFGAGGTLIAVTANESAQHALLAGGRRDRFRIGLEWRFGSHQQSLEQGNPSC